MYEKTWKFFKRKSVKFFYVWWKPAVRTSLALLDPDLDPYFLKWLDPDRIYDPHHWILFILGKTDLGSGSGIPNPDLDPQKAKTLDWWIQIRSKADAYPYHCIFVSCNLTCFTSFNYIPNRTCLQCVRSEIVCRIWIWNEIYVWKLNFYLLSMLIYVETV